MSDEYFRFRENQRTINDWQDLMFPNATEQGVLNHLKEEFQEFTSSIDPYEAADVVILLYAWAKKRNIDLHTYIDAKMRINRDRDWNIQKDGTGRHKK